MRPPDHKDLERKMSHLNPGLGFYQIYGNFLNFFESYFIIKSHDCLYVVK